MKYFEIHIDLNPKVSGIRNGVNAAHFSEKFWSKNPEIRNFMFGDNNIYYIEGKSPEFSLDLIGLELKKSAKMVDFIGLGALVRGYIVSDKVRDILEKFTLPKHKFHKVIFHIQDHNNILIEERSGYWWFYFEVESGEFTIDFSKSVFDYSIHIERYNQKFEVNSYRDYVNILTRYPPALKAKEIYIMPNFFEYDFWGNKFLSARNYISETLYNNFSSQSVTGFKVKSPECAITGRSL